MIKLKLGLQVARRLNSLRVPRTPESAYMVGQWLEHGGVLVIRDLPDHFKQMDWMRPLGETDSRSGSGDFPDRT